MTRMKMAKLAAEHISLLVVLNVLQKEKIGMEKNGAMETVSGQMTNVKMQNWIHGGTLLQMKIQTSGIHMVVKNPASPPQLELTVLLVNILTSFTVMPLDSASTRRMFVMDIRIQAAAVMTKTLNVVWTNTSKEGLLRNMPLWSVKARCIQVIMGGVYQFYAQQFCSRIFLLFRNADSCCCL